MVLVRIWYSITQWTLYKLKWSRFRAFSIVNFGEQMGECVSVDRYNITLLSLWFSKEWYYLFSPLKWKIFMWASKPLFFSFLRWKIYSNFYLHRAFCHCYRSNAIFYIFLMFHVCLHAAVYFCIQSVVRRMIKNKIIANKLVIEIHIFTHIWSMSTDNKLKETMKTRQCIRCKYMCYTWDSFFFLFLFIVSSSSFHRKKNFFSFPPDLLSEE